MNKLFNWKSILFLSIFIGLMLLSSVIYIDFKTLPSENWSKYITLYTSDVTDQTQNYYDDIIAVSDDNNKLLVTFSDHEMLYFKRLGQDGQIQESFSYKLDENVKTISTLVDTDHLNVLIASEHSIDLYNFSLSDFKLISKDNVTSQYDRVKIFENKAVYYDQNQLFYFDGQKTTFLSKNDKLEQFDFKVDQNSLYINVLEYDFGSYYFSIYHYDLQNDKIKYNSKIKKINTISGTISLDANLLVKDNQLYNCLILKNNKYGQNFEFNLILDKTSMAVLNTFNESNLSYDPNTQYIEYNDQVYIAYNDKSFIGKMEIGSQYKTFTNVFLKPIDSNDMIEGRPNKILTKSQNYAPNLKFISIGDYNYLLTTEIDHGQNKIYLSSDAPEIIKQSQKITFTDYRNIFFGALTYIPASIMTSWMVIIGLLFPVVFVIIPIAIVKMNWVERNPIKMLYAALISYIIVKIYYVFTNLNILAFTSATLGAPPVHLSSIFLTALTFIFTTGISLVCIFLYLKKKPDTHFIASFFIFFIFEMVQYLIYITTYAVMYM